jgi:hypothetical protein
MIIDDLRCRPLDGQCEISARVRRGDNEHLRLWWRFPERFTPAHLDGSPFLAGALLWAMRHREDVTVDAPVSGRLLASAEGIVAVYRSLFPDQVGEISIAAPTANPPPSTDATGCFFSRGVDSWYGALTALEDDPQSPPLTHLVFSPDFFPVDQWPRRVLKAKSAATVDAALRTGCRVVQVETNLKRDFGGAQLSSTALALGLSRVLIGSGAMHGEIVPAGTHPALDHRFSTERTQVVHYGDANRLDKVARIARSRDAMETLHVCRANSATDDRNCGRCEKCLRTMLELHVAGALDGCPAFTEPLTPAAVAGLRKPLGRRHQWVEVLHALRNGNGDRELAAAVRLVIAQNDLRKSSTLLSEAASDPSLARIDPALGPAARRATELSMLAHRTIDPAAPGRWRELLARLKHALGRGAGAVPSARTTGRPGGRRPVGSAAPVTPPR